MQLFAQEKRFGMIDIARFYAMTFVFFGHFIERLMILENLAATLQYRFVYSFHMVLFVVLAGYVARDGDPHDLAGVRPGRRACRVVWQGRSLEGLPPMPIRWRCLNDYLTLCSLIKPSR